MEPITDALMKGIGALSPVISVAPEGITIPALGQTVTFLGCVRIISVFFTSAVQLQMGVKNLLSMTGGAGMIAGRLGKDNWKGFADSATFADGPLRVVWLAGILAMTMLQLVAGACGLIYCVPFIKVDAAAAPFGWDWGFACGVVALAGFAVAVLGMRWIKDYPAAAATFPYVTLALYTAVVHLPLDGVDVRGAVAGHTGFRSLEILVTAFVAAVFVQSGLDKVFDWGGNSGWLSGYFADTLIAPLWLPGLLTLSLLENFCGFVALFALIFYQQGGHDVVARNTAILSLLGMLASLAVVIVGMLFKYDHGQAGPIVPYVTFALCGITILSLGY